MILERTLYRIVNRGKIAHGLFRLYPRTTALAPPRTIEQTHFNIEFGSGLEHGMQNLPPFVGKHFHRACWSALTFSNHPDLYAVDAYLLHGLEILNDSFFRNVSVYPVPIHGKRLVFRSFDKCLLHFVETFGHDWLTGEESGYGC